MYLIHSFTVGSIHFSLLGQHYWKIFFQQLIQSFFSVFWHNWYIYKLQKISYKVCQNYALSFTLVRPLTTANYLCHSSKDCVIISHHIDIQLHQPCFPSTFNVDIYQCYFYPYLWLSQTWLVTSGCWYRGFVVALSHLILQVK